MDKSRERDILFQSPIQIKIGKRQLNVYPLTLGKIEELGRYPFFCSGHLSIGEGIVKLCADDFPQACSILSTLTFRTKEEALDREMVNERARYIQSHCDKADLPVILHAAIYDDTESVMSMYGIDKDIEQKREIAKIKDTPNSRQFGCRSLWGAYLDTACSKYGWTIDYVLWGISYANLRMMMADASSSVYLTDEEVKKVRSASRSTLRADDPANAEKILRRREGICL